MKQCPNCKKAYADDLFFCLDDGTALTPVAAVSPTAPTVANIPVDRSPVTEVIPRVITTETTKKNSVIPYIAIGALAMLCIGLVVVLGLLYFGRDPVATNDVKTAQTPSRGVSSTPVTQPTSVVIAGDSPTPKPASSVAAFDPSGRWRGQWSTDSGSLYDIEVALSVTDNRLDGQIRWTMRRTALPNKADKVGLSATEYVRGSFDPSTGVVNFSGYRKDDPNSMLLMLDAYKLNISKDGKSMNGAARNGGKWNGHVKLSR